MKYQIVVFVLTAFFSCKSSIEKRVARQANKCQNENCKVRVADLTDFQWDKMVVFNYSISDAVVNDAIWFDYKNYDDQTRPWIFIKNNRIVYAENNPAGIEGPVEGEVAFDGPDSLKFMVYTPKTAIFSVKKETANNKSYYLLH